MTSIRKTLALLTAILLVISIAACSSNKNKGSSPASSAPPASSPASSDSASPKDSQPPQDEITLDVFSMLSNFSGEQTGWFAKVVKDKFNIKLNIISSNLEGGGDTKYAAMMASGSLGDLVVFGDDGQKYLDAIKAGMLVDWTKDGLLDKYGQNIMKYAPKAIEKNKKNFGGGTSVWGIGNDVGDDRPGPSEAKELNYHPNLRWDIYSAIGRPEVKTMEDYLPVLKQMQEKYPKSDSGRPTYGFSLWGDWDGNMMVLAKSWAALHGFDETDGFSQGGFTLISADKDELQGVLDEDGYYIRALKLYYQANQMGLLDPDSATQKFDDYLNKMKDGQVLFSMFSWGDDVYNTPEHLAEGKGLELVPFSEERDFSYGFDPYGSSRVWAIGSKSKHPDRVMQFLDWMYSPEGRMVADSGPEGLMWELKDGKQALTALGEQSFPAAETPIPDEYGGGNWKDGRNQINNTTFKNTAINPLTGDPYDYTLWASTLAKAPDKLHEDWNKAMDATSPKDYLEKHNMLAIVKPLFTGEAPTPYPADLEQKRGQVATVIKQYSWKMIYAKNEAEFEKLKKDMIGKAKGLGYDEVLAFNIEQNKKVFEYRKNS